MISISLFVHANKHEIAPSANHSSCAKCADAYQYESPSPPSKQALVHDSTVQIYPAGLQLLQTQLGFVGQRPALSETQRGPPFDGHPILRKSHYLYKL